MLKGIEKHGFEVVAEFDAPGGLRGFGQPAAAYVTADGKHVLVGSLFDAEGNDVAAEAVEKLVAAPMSAKMWTKLEASAWVRDGKADAPRVVYTFSDANCPYCHKFWEAARPWVDAGKVQLRHIMVGVIREDSPAKAAAISRRVIRARRCWRMSTSSTVAASRRYRASAARSQACQPGPDDRDGLPGHAGHPVPGCTRAGAASRGLPQGADLQTVLGPLIAANVVMSDRPAWQHAGLLHFGAPAAGGEGSRAARQLFVVTSES